MIENQWQRSSEFFSQPVQAGKAARAMPFSMPQILSFHLLLAIVNGLIEYLIQPNFDFSDQMLTVNPEQADALMALQAGLDAIYASPFTLTALSFGMGLLSTTFFWQIGRAVGGAEVSFEAAQSAMLRFLLIKRGISAVVVLLLFLLPLGFLGAFGLIGMIYLNVIYLFVIQGAMELKSGFAAIWVVFLSYLAMLGIASLLMLILSLVF